MGEIWNAGGDVIPTGGRSRPAECGAAIKLAHQELKAPTPHPDPEQSYVGTPASIREENRMF